MHRLYKESCLENNKKAVTYEIYAKIFNQYNLSFHKPRKDICKTCLGYNNNTNRTEADETKQSDHLARKQECRDEKDKDKERAKQDNTFHVTPSTHLHCTFLYPSHLCYSNTYIIKQLAGYNSLLLETI